MSKEQSGDIYVGVEVCSDCADIHLVLWMEGQEWRASVALTDEEWQRLISNYHTARQRQLSPGGGRLQ